MGSRSRQKIIDAHMHWWDVENNYYPWLTDKLAESQESGLAGAATRSNITDCNCDNSDRVFGLACSPA